MGNRDDLELGLRGSMRRRRVAVFLVNADAIAGHDAGRIALAFEAGLCPLRSFQAQPKSLIAQTGQERREGAIDGVLETRLQFARRSETKVVRRLCGVA